jgi:predicted phosphodiesterase
MNPDHIPQTQLPSVEIEQPSSEGDRLPADPPHPGEMSAVSPGNRRRKKLIHLALVAFFFLLAALGAAASTALFGGRSYHWRAFTVQLAMTPSLRGETRISLTPLGDVRAKTHSAPVTLQASLEKVNFNDLRDLVASPPDKGELEREFKHMAERSVRDFVRWQVFVACLGGLLAPALYRSKRLRGWIAGGLTGALISLGMAGFIFEGFHPAAFENPVYTGSLREATWIISMGKEAFDKAQQLSDRLKRVAKNINELYGRLDALPRLDGEKEAIRVLHISDIHNNPAAVEFVREILKGLAVDLIIDTGDLTDFGLPLETRLTKRLVDTKEPYVFIPGNHDSEETVASVRSQPATFVLEGKPVEVAGLTILGAPDPSSKRPGHGNVNTTPEELKQGAVQLAQAFDADAHKPDIMCVHNLKQVEPLIGSASVILCGHTHAASLVQDRGTWICNAGTTGAAGVRYLDKPGGVALTAAVLAFSKSVPHRLLYVDQIAFDGSLSRYSVTRQTVGAQPLGTAPAQAPVAVP